MDKPKESKVRTRVMEILRNHDQEARVIEAQIAAERKPWKPTWNSFLNRLTRPVSYPTPASASSLHLTQTEDWFAWSTSATEEDKEQTKRSATWNANFNRSQRFKTWSTPWTPVRNASFLPCTTLTGHTTKRLNSFKSKEQLSIDKEKSP